VTPLTNRRWTGNGDVGFSSLPTEAKAGNHPRKGVLTGMKNETSRTVLAELRHRFPWPTRQPEVSPVLWEMDYGGRELIKKLILQRSPRVIVEIGAFVGGSIRQWLAASPDSTIVAIDPWYQISGPVPFFDTHPVGHAHGRQLRETDGLYRAFLSTLWEHRERVIPVRGTGCEMLPALHSAGLQPDLIFIDADKQAAEIQLCDELFPEAIVCGDDWLWCDGKRFPTQRPVRDSARRRGRILKVVSNTWLIDDTPWTIEERWLWLLGLKMAWGLRKTAWKRARQGLDSAGNPTRT